jgi:Ribbon-helix-helix protein, copG family
MTQLIRKQIYIEKRQDALLKRQAKLRGVSEAELIREAIDKQLAQAAVRKPVPPDQDAWERALKFMKELRDRGPLPVQGRTWSREDGYEERLSRYERRTG